MQKKSRIFLSVPFILSLVISVSVLAVCITDLTSVYAEKYTEAKPQEVSEETAKTMPDPTLKDGRLKVFKSNLMFGTLCVATTDAVEDETVTVILERDEEVVEKYEMQADGEVHKLATGIEPGEYTVRMESAKGKELGSLKITVMNYPELALPTIGGSENPDNEEILSQAKEKVLQIAKEAAESKK